MKDDILLSVVVPVFNEAKGLEAFQNDLQRSVKSASHDSFEIIYVDDGSHDNTSELIHGFRQSEPRIKLIRLSRNFGKENALAAGITSAQGQAVLMMDGDGQHPIELIGDFVKQWQEGNKVVVGVRRRASDGDWFKKLGAKVFYRLFNRLTGERLIHGSTDFRLIDRDVQKAFLGLSESDRMTRGLIDWLGFKRSLIYFEAKPRQHGRSPYSRGKLIGLATNSFVSLTPVPLFLFGYLGVFITLFALVLGSVVFIEQVLFSDPWHWHFTGTAMIGILLLFLVGLLLMAQGMLSLYISHIHSQTKRRPLYVIDYENSAGVKQDQ